jgi:hypothetical protein
MRALFYPQKTIKTHSVKEIVRGFDVRALVRLVVLHVLLVRFVLLQFPLIQRTQLRVLLHQLFVVQI